MKKRVYKVTRRTLNKLKKKYNMQDESDYSFLQWWRRNHGTGYEEDIKIIE